MVKKSMKLYLVRHGQTDANVSHLFNGINEKDLTEFGVEQAKQLIPEIEKLPLDLIISSPLKRTVHTAQILNCKNIELITDKRLIERDYKDLTLKPISFIKNKDSLYDLGSYEEIEGIESFQSMYDRIESFIKEIKFNYNNKNILIVTHGDVIVAIKMYIEKKKNPDYPKTCELIRYEI